MMQAVILAGGRSKRLGGVAKATLLVDGVTLLARTVDAAASAIGVQAPPGENHGGKIAGAAAASTTSRIVVVGPDGPVEGLRGPHVQLVREDPPFAGPAAGIAAGAAALDGAQGHVLVLACDMVHVAELVPLLVAGLSGCGPLEGVMAVDGGRRQPLAAIYPWPPLREAIAQARAAHRLQNASVFSLLASVMIKECAVPAGMTADIDTWDDARIHGIVVQDMK